MLKPLFDPEVWKKGKEEGRKEGKQEGKKEVAKKLLELGIEWDTIVQATGLGEEELKKH